MAPRQNDEKQTPHLAEKCRPGGSGKAWLEPNHVDKDGIGAMGICAGTGYNFSAAINDRWIKAVGTVCAVNIGQMFRNGFTGDTTSADAMALLVDGSNARTAEAGDVTLASMKKADAPKADLEEAWEYYDTPTAQYPTAPRWTTAGRLTQIIPYDAYNMAALAEA
jgi:uncharacterized protein